MEQVENIKSRLKRFKSRYYTRQLILGVLLFLILALALISFVSGLEYQFWMDISSRTIVFFLSLSIISGLFVWLVGYPLSRLLNISKGLSDEAAADEIARFFPSIQDKLKNTLQLSSLDYRENALLKAAIEKKTDELKPFQFPRAVDFSTSKRYAVILGLLFFCLLLVSFINPAIINDSSKRIVNYHKEFVREAPFTFVVSNESLDAFRGEDFRLFVQIEGKTIPQTVKMLTSSGGTIPLEKTGEASYQYLFPGIRKEVAFKLEGGGFESETYTINVNDRPNLIAMNIIVNSPSYTNKKQQTVSNGGDLTVLEGSRTSWEITTLKTDSIAFSIGNEQLSRMPASPNRFRVNKQIFRNTGYSITLFNDFGKNPEQIEYNIQVVKDQPPVLNMEYFPDTINYRFITLAGNVIDDYGFSSLTLFYEREGKPAGNIPFEMTPGSTNESFYSNWNTDSLNLKPGEKLSFYVSVGDNDEVNGIKYSRSQTFYLRVPGKKEIQEAINKKSDLVKNRMDKSRERAVDINKQLEELENRLKSRKKLEWQDRKQVSDLLKNREKLEKQIQELQKQSEELNRANDQFNEQSERLKEQQELLQEQLNELMNKETLELYEKLKEKLENENARPEDIREEIDQIKKNEQELQKELQRAIELFKKLKMESLLEKSAQTLDSLGAAQEELSREDSWEDMHQLQEKQKEIQEGFEDYKKQMEEAKEINESLRKPETLTEFELEERQISRELEQIQERLNENTTEQEGGENAQGEQKEGEQGQNKEQQGESQENQEGKNGEQQSGSQSPKDKKETQKKQKNTGQKMQQLGQQLSKQQAGMQMEAMSLNMDRLRDILDNLLKLSFSQEDILEGIRGLDASNPRFIDLSQQQLKLKDDAKVIQDSLLSLAEDVAQISSFVTREVGNINEHVEKAVKELKSRRQQVALFSQQSAMMSMNNLALMLNNTLQDMQMQMSEAMGQSSEPSEGQQQGLEQLQQMQQQLGEGMEELQQSGKSGRELSKELSKLAGEQEMIRRELERLKQSEDGKPGSQAGDELKRAIDQMKRNEIDLVNKRITQQLIRRQKQIMVRLLEAEKAQREQEEDDEREAESPGKFERDVPPDFEEYLKTRQKEIELLKTIPLQLNPFYKKEVNNYFRRISSEKKE